MKISSIFGALAVGLLAVSVASGPAAATTTTTTTTTDLGPDEGDTLSASEENLLQSGVPIKVVIDEETGLPLHVEQLTQAELDELAGLTGAAATARTAFPNACTTGRGCWRGVALPSGPPSQSIGFSVGVTTGSWNNRGDFWVPAGLKAKICWVSNQCTDRHYGPSVLIETGGNVVGTKVDIVRS